MSHSTPPLPPQFLSRMQIWLGDEYSEFENALNQMPVSGLRINTLKISKSVFEKISPFALGNEIPWCSSAFTLQAEDKPGKHPYHLAGLYYLQDPSAMSPAELFAPQPGHRVLDLAAAPGGKTTHLAALMQGQGLLVANEIKNKRLGHLAQNIERWGAGNVVITNETPERLADHFGAFFDGVLVDAPCSGEGMFRKDMGARLDWSLEMVQGCAARQGNILHVAGKLVRPGGRLLYSTCTFAPEEDEGVIAHFLDKFPDFEVVELPQYPGFMTGRPEWIGNETNIKRTDLQGAVRLFPHRLAGEGHFACLLQKKNGYGTDHGTRFATGDGFLLPTRAQLGFWRDFAAGLLARFDESRFRVAGERLYYIPDEMPNLGRLRVVHPGVWLGVLKKDRFEPAHPLALFLHKSEFPHALELGDDEVRLAAYLRGETLEAGVTGWTLVTVAGFGLGWGKGVQGTLKNHYPRGWMQA